MIILPAADTRDLASWEANGIEAVYKCAQARRWKIRAQRTGIRLRRIVVAITWENQRGGIGWSKSNSNSRYTC